MIFNLGSSFHLFDSNSVFVGNMLLTPSDAFLFAAVSTSMPQFHQMMGERLRSVEQGADTVVWLALSRAAARTRSGQFFQGEQHESLSHTNTKGDFSIFLHTAII